jgi:hypothetical protein
MTLRDRCSKIANQLQRDAMLRQGNPVETIMAFVQAEMGRTADERLDDTCSMILYFGNETDRAEFQALILEAKPGMVAKEIP